MGACAHEALARLLPHCVPPKVQRASGGDLVPLDRVQQRTLQQRQAQLHEEIYELELHRLQLLRPRLPDGWQVAYLDAPAIFYKVVAAVRGELVSVFDGVTRYQVGRWSTSRRGALGWPPLDTCYYAFDSPAAATHVPFPGNSRCLSAPRVLIRMEGKGRAYCKGDGMWALSAVRPVGIESDLEARSATIISSKPQAFPLLTG